MRSPLVTGSFLIACLFPAQTVEVETRAAVHVADAGTVAAPALGLVLADGNEGALVRRVEPESPSDGVVEPGDEILEVDGTEVKSAHDARRELASRTTGTVVMRVKRNGVTHAVTLVLRS